MNTTNWIKLLRKYGWDLLAILVLSLFFVISVGLIQGESATTDEEAHIPAGYSYVMLGDYTLNPEHPPLAKLIAGLGFIGSHFSFPVSILHGENKVTDRQWQAGNAFLYHSGNNTNEILLRSRLPILIASVIGLFVCYWLFALISSKKIALVTLVFLALSPTVIAHGHLVTTDVLVMTAATIALLCFVRYLERLTPIYAIAAGVTLAVAQLSKFSAALLFVLYPLAAMLFFYAKQPGVGLGRVVRLALRTVVPVVAVALVTVYGVYSLQVVRLSHVAQNDWIVHAVDAPSGRWSAPALLDLNAVPFMPPVVRYLIGLGGSFGRVELSQGANLLGKDYVNGPHSYFPIISILKTPTPLLVLWTLMGVSIATYVARRLGSFKKFPHALLGYVRTQPALAIGMLFASVYFTVAATGSLDIGIRHLSPLFPWVAFASALWLVRVLGRWTYRSLPLGKLLCGGIVAVFVAIAVVVYPNYLPYTTELAGGSPQAYRYYNDSNVDWGQSLKYQATYARTHPNMLPLYTTRGSHDAANYYMCGHPNCPQLRSVQHITEIPHGSYFVASETVLTIAWGRNEYNELNVFKDKTPAAKVGDSVFIYYVP